jgi:DNA polymerase-4
MQLYASVSDQIHHLFHQFTPQVESISIDEAFLDMTGTQRLWGEPYAAAVTISTRIKKEFRLTASIGIAVNKFLAKVASDLNKPAGITMAPFQLEQIQHWLAPMPVGRIYGLGQKTQKSLTAIGIETIADLQKQNPSFLLKRFSKTGLQLLELSKGIDDRAVECSRDEKSISREHTFDKDNPDLQCWLDTLLTLSQDVGYRARKSRKKGSTVVLTFRTPDFKRFRRQTTLKKPTDLAKTIHETAAELLKKEMNRLTHLRLIGVGITHFEQSLQTDLFQSVQSYSEKAWEASERAIDVLNNKFGRSTVVRATQILKSP